MCRFNSYWIVSRTKARRTKWKPKSTLNEEPGRSEQQDVNRLEPSSSQEETNEPEPGPDAEVGENGNATQTIISTAAISCAKSVVQSCLKHVGKWTSRQYSVTNDYLILNQSEGCAFGR